MSESEDKTMGYVKEKVPDNRQKTPTEEKQQEQQETNEMLLAEDAVETTVYLAHAPDCCSGGERLENVLGMLGANVMDEDIYHSEDQHPTLSM